MFKLQFCVYRTPTLQCILQMDNQNDNFGITNMSMQGKLSSFMTVIDLVSVFRTYTFQGIIF